MNRFIALYRGINVGGRNPVKMELLRAMHDRLGHEAVANYIQSGNIVFSANGLPTTITQKIAAQFAQDFGFAAKVIVVPAASWLAIVRDNPYANISAKHPTAVHAAICQGKPNAKALKALQEKINGTETFVIKGELIYLHAPNGFGTSKFAAGMEKAAGVPVTVRNWRTMETLWKMLNDAGINT
jgi:uncharacterized protein (DUF1697 family)